MCFKIRFIIDRNKTLRNKGSTKLTLKRNVATHIYIFLRWVAPPSLFFNYQHFLRLFFRYICFLILVSLISIFFPYRGNDRLISTRADIIYCRIWAVFSLQHCTINVWRWKNSRNLNWRTVRVAWPVIIIEAVIICSLATIKGYMVWLLRCCIAWSLLSLLSWNILRGSPVPSISSFKTPDSKSYGSWD